MENVTGTVLIAGAGPTGMMAALELSRFGIPVRLIEKTHEPATTSRAVGVQARTLELLEQRGLSESLVSRGNPGVAVSVYGDGKRVFRLGFEHIDSSYKYILFVSQAETERVLRDAIETAGVKVEWGVTMTAFAQPERGERVTAVLQDQNGRLEQIDCSYFISAEGAHSTARQTLGLHFEGKSLLEDYALGDFYVDGDLSDSDLHVFSSEHGFLGMFPMGGKRYRLIASNPISKPSKDTTPSIAELQQLYDQRSHIPVHFHDMSWSSWFRINSRMIHTMNVEKIFLGGDSAHIHSPAGAQGMNTGMQDMVNLAWKMAMVLKRQAKPDVLATYEAERVPVIRGVLTKTESLTHTIGEENRLFRSVFNHIAPWIVSTDLIQQESTESMSQLALGYRGSPLSVSASRSGSLHAGDRVPNVAVTVVNREGSAEPQPRAATTFGLMDPSTFTLFYSNIPDPAATHAEVGNTIGAWHHLMRGHQIAPTQEDSSAFHHLFGTSPSILLVRPDGYVAFAGKETSIPDLAQYCDRWLLPLSPAVSAHHA